MKAKPKAAPKTPVLKTPVKKIRQFSLKNLKLNIFWIIRCSRPLIFSIIVVSILILMNFLYQNVYQTISQAEQLTKLKKEVSKTPLKTEIFQAVVAKMAKKTAEFSQPIPTKLNDPFNPAPAQKSSEETPVEN